jgi:hypothetical protein
MITEHGMPIRKLNFNVNVRNMTLLAGVDLKGKKKKKIQAKIKQKKKNWNRLPVRKIKIEIDPRYNGFLDPPLLASA